MKIMPVLVPFWLSGNALVSMNLVTAWSVPGWVTILAQENHLGAEPGPRSTQPHPSLCG